jgi:hypothetical protein
VVAEDEAAVAENEELTDTCVREERNASVARSAHAQLEVKIAETKTAREKAVRAVHQERYKELAKERGHLDTRIEAAMGDLREGISELEDIHNRQLIEAQGAGDPLLSHVAETHLQSVLQSWLGARLGWLVETTAATPLYDAPLPESDRLAIAPANAEAKPAEPKAE